MNVNNEKEKTSYKYLAILIITVIAIWGFSGYILYFFKDRGTFGDMFGAVNALFSGLAFASLIFTIYLQSEDLKLQRKELSDTRQEIKEQKEYLAAQNEVLKTQNFENTFFQLLKLLDEITDSVQFENEGPIGHKSFKYIYAKLQGRFRSKEINDYTNEEVISFCNDFYYTNQDVFGHYFRTLYNIIKFVKHSNVSDKRFYTNLVRAQISEYETLVIFYDCLSDLGSERFKPLVEEFALLKTIKKERLIKPEHMALFSETAFK